MTTELPQNLIEDRYTNRRQMAWWSFRLILLVGVPLLVYGLTSDERAARVESMSFVLGTLFGVWVSVVLAYFGATTFTDRKELEMNRNASYAPTYQQEVQYPPTYPTVYPAQYPSYGQPQQTYPQPTTTTIRSEPND